MERKEVFFMNVCLLGFFEEQKYKKLIGKFAFSEKTEYLSSEVFHSLSLG